MESTGSGGRDPVQVGADDSSEKKPSEDEAGGGTPAATEARESK